MPRDMTKAMQSPRCSAMSKRTRKQCRSPAMANGTCHMHGGATPPGQQPNLKHGLFATFLPPKVAERFAAMPAGKLDDLIDLLYWQIGEALRLQYEEPAEDPPDGEGLELDEIKDEAGPDGAKHTRRYRRPDYRAHLDRLSGRLIQAEQARAAIRGDKGESVDELAAKIKATLKAIG